VLLNDEGGGRRGREGKASQLPAEKERDNLGLFKTKEAALGLVTLPALAFMRLKMAGIRPVYVGGL